MNFWKKKYLHFSVEVILMYLWRLGHVSDFFRYTTNCLLFTIQRCLVDCSMTELKKAYLKRAKKMLRSLTKISWSLRGKNRVGHKTKNFAFWRTSLDRKLILGSSDVFRFFVFLFSMQIRFFPQRWSELQIEIFSYLFCRIFSIIRWFLKMVLRDK